MIRTIPRIFRRMAVILVAVGIVTLGVYAFSVSPLASSLSEQRGGLPAAMMNAEASTDSTSGSGIVLVDYVSSDTGTAAQTADMSTTDTQTAATTQMQRPMMGEGGHEQGVNLSQALPLVARNLGILVAVSAVVAVIQTALKRRKKPHKMTMAAA